MLFRSKHNPVDLTDPTPSLARKFKLVAELMVHGPDVPIAFEDKRDGSLVELEPGRPVTDPIVAAQIVGLKIKLARRLPYSPVYQKAYAEACDLLKSGQRARNIHAAISVRDRAFDPDATAAQQTVSLKAAAYLDGDDPDGRAASSVNIQINGYVMDLTGDSEPARPLIDVTPNAQPTDPDDE